MHGYGLAQPILLGGHGAGLVACFALLAFSGLLRPLERRARVKPPRPARPENPTPTLRLSAIELGLLAELSLEQARAYEELVDDASQEPETRRAAAATAVGWRDRARAFQWQARHQGAAPIVAGEHSSSAYTGPERRRQTRRRQTRRTGASSAGQTRRTGAPEAVGVDRADRRYRPDRRHADRRRPHQIAA